ncbi:MAG: DNA polymerase Y family protein [Chloroflexi bacterium]|nr:DNA polymerase Y family protein [Chloroflexota bacterium]
MRNETYIGPLSTLAPPRHWPQGGVACIWLPLLPLRAELLRHPEWRGKPVVMSGGPGDRKVVQLCSPEAERAGIRPGLPLREVLPLSRETIVLQPDPVRSAVVREEVLSRLQRQICPAVEMPAESLDTSTRPRSQLGITAPAVEHGTFFVDLRGLGPTYHNNLSAFEQALRKVIPPVLDARLGIGAGKFIAWVAAQCAPAQGRQSVPEQEARAFLAPLSVRYLPLPATAQQRLELLAITTIGQLAALPFSAVQAQFGKAGARAWRLAQGQDNDPVQARPYAPTVRTFLRCDDALASIEAVMAAIDQLLIQAFAKPVMQGASARQVRFRALLSDGSSWEKSLTFKEPLAGSLAARQSVSGKLKATGMLPLAPVEELQVELLGIGPEFGRQLPLFGNRVRRQPQLSEAIRQITARYGHTPLYRPVEVEPWSRLPERRWVLVEAVP